jgi:hypothetical protein
MQNKQDRALQAQERTLAWCAANPTLVPPAVGSPDAWSTITRQYSALSTAVAASAAAAAKQSVSATNATLEATGEPSLRAHLRQELRAVTQVAQALKTTVPGISILRMPPVHIGATALVTATDGFITQASTYASVLVEHTLPADFITQLQDARSALAASIVGRGTARAGRVSASKDLVASLTLGKQLVQVLDSALTKALKDNPAKLAEWKNIKRVTVKGVVNSGASTTPAFTTPATPPVSTPVTAVADAKAV